MRAVTTIPRMVRRPGSTRSFRPPIPLRRALPRFYVHQEFNLAGTRGEFRKQRDSLVPDFRTSEERGSGRLSSNPGAFIVGYGLDADLTPKLRGFLDHQSTFRPFHTRVNQQVIFTGNANNDIGWVFWSLGFNGVPLLRRQHYRNRCQIQALSGSGAGLQVDVRAQCSARDPGFTIRLPGRS